MQIYNILPSGILCLVDSNHIHIGLVVEQLGASSEYVNDPSQPQRYDNQSSELLRIESIIDNRTNPDP